MNQWQWKRSFLSTFSEGDGLSIERCLLNEEMDQIAHILWIDLLVGVGIVARRGQTTKERLTGVRLLRPNIQFRRNTTFIFRRLLPARFGANKKEQEKDDRISHVWPGKRWSREWRIEEESSIVDRDVSQCRSRSDREIHTCVLMTY